MNFHEVRFPTNISYGSSGGPERRTDIVTLANGFEERNTPWAHSRRRYDAGLGMNSLDDVDEIIAFFEARRGQIYGFRWKDWADYKSCGQSAEIAVSDQLIAMGDGLQLSFQLIKTYSSGDASYLRPISKPVEGTVAIALDGVALNEGRDWNLDYSSGFLSFTNPPPQGAHITAGFEFDVPVRFDTSRIVSSVASFQAGEIPDVPVVEVRV